MKIPKIMKKMISYSEGNLHDIHHFMLVWSYAKTIGELEKLDTESQLILEIAAILHDIACPLCRKKYGNTNGKYQETEGVLLAREFLQDIDISEPQKERILYLIGHHHTFTDVVGVDYQILIEADYIVNAAESGYSAEQIKNFANTICKTSSGRALLEAVYGVSPSPGKESPL